MDLENLAFRMNGVKSDVTSAYCRAPQDVNACVWQLTSSVSNVLGAQGADWEDRVAAMRHLSAHREALFEAGDVRSALRPLHESFAQQLKDLRSGVVKAACECLASVVQCVQAHAASLVDHVLPDLLALVSKTNQVMASAAHDCFMKLVLCTPVNITLDHLLPAAQHKSHARRYRALLYVTAIMMESQPSWLDAYASVLGATVVTALSDSRPKVRAQAVLAWQTMAANLPRITQRDTDRRRVGLDQSDTSPPVRPHTQTLEKDKSSSSSLSSSSSSSSTQSVKTSSGSSAPLQCRRRVVGKKKAGRRRARPKGKGGPCAAPSAPKKAVAPTPFSSSSSSSSSWSASDVPHLLGQCAAPSWQARCKGQACLQQLVASHALPKVPGAIITSLRKCVRDANHHAMRAAVTTLVTLCEHYESDMASPLHALVLLLLPRLHDGKQVVRQHVRLSMERLASSVADSLAPALVQALDHSDARLVSAALSVLRQAVAPAARGFFARKRNVRHLVCKVAALAAPLSTSAEAGDVLLALMHHQAHARHALTGALPQPTARLVAAAMRASVLREARLTPSLVGRRVSQCERQEVLQQAHEGDEGHRRDGPSPPSPSSPLLLSHATASHPIESPPTSPLHMSPATPARAFPTPPTTPVHVTAEAAKAPQEANAHAHLNDATGAPTTPIGDAVVEDVVPQSAAVASPPLQHLCSPLPMPLPLPCTPAMHTPPQPHPSPSPSPLSATPVGPEAQVPTSPVAPVAPEAPVQPSPEALLQPSPEAPVQPSPGAPVQPSPGAPLSPAPSQPLQPALCAALLRWAGDPEAQEECMGSLGPLVASHAEDEDVIAAAVVNATLQVVDTLMRCSSSSCAGASPRAAAEAFASVRPAVERLCACVEGQELALCLGLALSDCVEQEALWETGVVAMLWHVCVESASNASSAVRALLGSAAGPACALLQRTCVRHVRIALVSVFVAFRRHCTPEEWAPLAALFTPKDQKLISFYVKRAQAKHG